ncbi:FAD-dependent tricarballylate dehydrogenase TcuA [Candidimonas humi]|uniref:FAD-dependent tricarballylate dehydrogenase TcuA n=1 Tax=Candidimonas humi TaxID=683355 RepID=A0ABV8P4D2_9BURK|nr:FAD-dependent tricarballylate dehydrogenase TcuA [Candidimonas humi]MBV6306931.1 FAD-dependent tricarballylate dehydrogenase TcuA [Candidimonas humi]
MEQQTHQYDVIVVGKGNAALCAALAARDTGARVAMLEAANEDESGGNSRFAGGVMRFAYSSVDDLKQVTDLTDEEVATSDFFTNTTDEFFDDLFRLTNYRTDPQLSEILVTQSLQAMTWLRSKGVKFVPNYGRQSVLVDGRRKFFGRLPIEVSGGGAGLVQFLDRAAAKAGIDIHYNTRARSLIIEDERIVGLRANQAGRPVVFRAKSVVLACGGFEANPEMRARYLGTGWELAKVRGSRFNQGEGLKMALDAGAAPYGNWSGCHATGWDLNAPEFGDVNVGDQFQKHSYIFGLLINAKGKRFVDEGLDFHSFTYAKYGGELLKQPGQFAWQVFDSKINKLLRSEYRVKMITKVTADTLEELAERLEGVDSGAALQTIKDYNASIRSDVPFDPAIKDGRCTQGIEPPKSNWAQALDTPPYHAYATTCGITFTFGGLRIDPDKGQVLDVDLVPMPGLYCAGEMVGGLFYFNYPSGTGLVSGAVFGRIAGQGAGQAAMGGA